MNIKPADFKIVELTEYQPQYFMRNEFEEDVAISLYENYGNQIDVEFPNPKTNFRWKITAKGWVGYIPVNSNFNVKINPKLPIKNLLVMLEYAYNLKSLIFFENLTYCQSVEDFYNCIAYILAQKITERCRKGLYRSYISKTEYLTYVRGRLNIQHIIQKPWNVKFKCEYEEHTADIIDNQILLWTLFNIGHSGYCSDRVSLIVRKAYHAMQSMVTLQYCTAQDCLEHNYHRLNEDYRILHQLCRFFLENTSPIHESGKNATVPFLVNMARLYELFVAQWLKGKIPQNLSLKTQERINIGENIYFQSDLILYENANLSPKYILDTKYKNSENIAKNDITQILTYAVSKNCTEAVLVYPIALNNPLDKYIGNIRVRSLTFSLNDNLEAAGNLFLRQLLS